MLCPPFWCPWTKHPTSDTEMLIVVTSWAMARWALPSDPRWIRISVPSHGPAAPTPTCYFHLICNIAEKSSVFLEERLKKKRNSLEKSKKSRHWKGQVPRTQEQSQSVAAKQNPLRLNNQNPLNCWQQLTGDSLFMLSCYSFEFIPFHGCKT